MFDWLDKTLGADGFSPRWYCGPGWQQNPLWGWLHIVSDIAIWGAYVAIPLVILHFVRHRRDIPFSRIFWLFSAFIFACGTVHLVEAVLFWWPIYRVSGLVKLWTAVISWTTVLALVRIVPMALSLRSPRDLEVEITRRTGQLHDITARLQAEVVERTRVATDLRASEEQLRLALEAGRMGTWDWDLTTDKTRFNACEIELTGLRTEEGLLDATKFFELVHEEDRPGLMKAIECAIRHHQPYDSEFRITTPDGVQRWLAGRGQVIRSPDGLPLRLVGVNFDITRNKQDDESLRLKTRAIEFATNGIVIVDARQPDLPVWDPLESTCRHASLSIL